MNEDAGDKPRRPSNLKLALMFAAVAVAFYLAAFFVLPR